MRLSRTVIALVAVVPLFGTVQTARADTSFGAIAFSPATGHYGYTFGRDCAADATVGALQNCYGADRRVVVMVGNGYAALAVNNGEGFGAAWSSRCQADADRAALRFAGGPRCEAHIICEVSSGV